MYNFLNVNIELIESLKSQLKRRFEEAKQAEDRQRDRSSEILQNYSVFKKAFDKIVQKYIPRCRTVLKIDVEYIRNTSLRERD